MGKEENVKSVKKAELVAHKGTITARPPTVHQKGPRRRPAGMVIGALVSAWVGLFAASCADSKPGKDKPLPTPSKTASATAKASATAPPASASASTKPAFAEKPTKDETGGVCPAGMVLVDGEYCSRVRQECFRWLENPAQNKHARCSEFTHPTACIGDKVHMHFCMDKYEAAEKPGGLPVADISYRKAMKACKAQGKRLCKQREWTFACEGEAALPYPYGYRRNHKICNFERKELLDDRGAKLLDHRQPVKSNPKCVSPFGIQNMVGNIDEWITLRHPHYAGTRKMMSGLKGGWWGPLRNRCRPVTVDHDEVFHELQTGYRCCKESSDGKPSEGKVTRFKGDPNKKKKKKKKPRKQPKKDKKPIGGDPKKDHHDGSIDKGRRDYFKGLAKRDVKDPAKKTPAPKPSSSKQP